VLGLLCWQEGDAGGDRSSPDAHGVGLHHAPGLPCRGLPFHAAANHPATSRGQSLPPACGSAREHTKLPCVPPPSTLSPPACCHRFCPQPHDSRSFWLEQARSLSVSPPVPCPASPQGTQQPTGTSPLSLPSRVSPASAPLGGTQPSPPPSPRTPRSPCPVPRTAAGSVPTSNKDDGGEPRWSQRPCCPGVGLRPGVWRGIIASLASPSPWGHAAQAWGHPPVPLQVTAAQKPAVTPPKPPSWAHPCPLGRALSRCPPRVTRSRTPGVRCSGMLWQPSPAQAELNVGVPPAPPPHRRSRTGQSRVRGTEGFGEDCISTK